MGETTFEEKFCKYLAHYVDSHKTTEKKGYISRLAKQLGVTQGQLSNVIAGRKFGDETWRRSVADKLGLDYDVMIGRSLIETRKLLEPKPNISVIASNKARQNQKSNIIELTRNIKSTDPTRLLKMFDDLREIYDSNNEHLVAAIEAELSSFRATVELSKKVSEIEKQLQSERKVKKKLMEENETLRNRLGDHNGTFSVLGQDT